MTKLSEYLNLIRRSHERILNTADHIGVQPALKLVYDAREHLMKRLYKLRSKSGRYTYVLMQQTKAQLDTEYKELVKLLNKHGANAFPDISKNVLNETAETLQKADKLFTGIVTPLQFTEASYVEYIAGKSAGSVLRHYKSSVARYGMETIEKIERHLGKSILAKDDTMSVINGIQDIIGGQQYKSERIFRTESASVAGRTEMLGIREAKRDLSDMQKRWSASPDACDCCASLDGKIIDTEQSFRCKAGKTELESLYEPMHPNCHCAVVSWRKAWGKV